MSSKSWCRSRKYLQKAPAPSKNYGGANIQLLKHAATQPLAVIPNLQVELAALEFGYRSADCAELIPRAGRPHDK